MESRLLKEPPVPRAHAKIWESAVSVVGYVLHSRLHLGGGSTGLQGRHRRRLPRVALNYWSVSCHRRTAADTLWYQTLTHLRVVWHCARAPAASRCRPPVDGSSSRSSAYLRRRIPNLRSPSRPMRRPKAFHGLERRRRRREERGLGLLRWGNWLLHCVQ